MNLSELLKKNWDGEVTFHSKKGDIDLKVSPSHNKVIVQDHTSGEMHIQTQFRGERQIAYLLEDYGMKTNDFDFLPRF